MITACFLALTLHTGSPIMVNVDHMEWYKATDRPKGAKTTLFLATTYSTHVQETPQEIEAKLSDCGIPVT